MSLSVWREMFTHLATSAGTTVVSHTFPLFLYLRSAGHA